MARIGKRNWFIIVCIACLGLLGSMILGIGRYVALERLRDRLPVQPSSDQSHLFDAALKSETGKIRLFSDPVPGLQGLAMLYHSNRYYPEALSVYTLLREIEPENPKWIYLCADIYQSTSDYKALRESLEQVNEMGSDYSPSLVKLGRIAMQSREMERAEALLKAALESDPNSISAHEALATYYGRTRDLENKRIIEERRNQFPGTGVGIDDPWLDGIFDYCYDLEQILVRVDICIENEDEEKALVFIERAIAIDPDDWKPHALLMYLNKRRGKAEAAIAAGKRAIETGADVETASAEIVSLLMENGQGNRAESFIKSVMQGHEGSSALYTLLADLQGKRGDNTAAFASLLHAEKLSPSSASIQKKMGELLWNQGKLDEAVFRFKRAVALSSHDSKSILYLVQYYLDRRQLMEAESWLQKALELEPENTELRAMASGFFERYGSSELTSGNFENAIRLLRLVVGMMPDAIQAKQKLADALFKSGQHNEGMALLDSLVNDGLAQPEVFMTLGELSLAKEDYEKARSYFEEVIARGNRMSGYARLIEAARLRIRIIDERSLKAGEPKG